MEEEIRAEAAVAPVESLVAGPTTDTFGDPDDEGDAFIGEPGQA